MFQDRQKQKIIDTLTNLLVPGGKYKVSPYIELAQYRVVFDEAVDGSKRREQLKRIIKKHSSRIESIANKISEFFLKKEFTREKYADPLFLDTYFVHYFPVNVCKMQHMMLELFQQETIGESLRIVDIGVGTGTTAVAILDFLLAAKTIAFMNGASFGIKDIKITCIDVSENPLRYSKRVLEAYREQLDRSSLDFLFYREIFACNRNICAIDQTKYE